MIITGKGCKGTLFNADTGQRIRWAFWANLETGEYKAHAAAPDGGKLAGPNGKPWVVAGRCRLRFVPAVLLPEHQATEKVSPPPLRRSGEAGVPALPRRGSRQRRRRVASWEDRPCEHYGCIRPAAWRVAWEKECSPILGADGRRYKAAEMIDCHWWCEWHYQFPQLYDPRGELIGDQIVKARPD